MSTGLRHADREGVFDTQIHSCSTLIDTLGLEEIGLNLAPSINDCAGKEKDRHLNFCLVTL